MLVYQHNSFSVNYDIMSSRRGSTEHEEVCIAARRDTLDKYSHFPLSVREQSDVDEATRSSAHARQFHNTHYAPTVVKNALLGTALGGLLLLLLFDLGGLRLDLTGTGERAVN